MNRNKRFGEPEKSLSVDGCIREQYRHRLSIQKFGVIEDFFALHHRILPEENSRKTVLK
jgi:hypothetical protein